MIKALISILRLGLFLNALFLTASVFLDLIPTAALYFFIGLEFVFLLTYGICQIVRQIIATIDYDLTDIDISRIKKRLQSYNLTLN